MTTRALSEISILDGSTSYSYFLQEHLEKNVPCLISPDLVSHWPAFSSWASSTASVSRSNWAYIREQYGDEVVSVAKCNLRERGFSDQERDERPVREVIDLWTSGDEAGRGLYVKDWHLAKHVRESGDPPFYDTPGLFRDDWMNSFWEEDGRDDFRFVYMGVEGTFTPLHRDVYTSYSWSTNITGTKIWRLFPPSVSHHLRRYPDRTSSETVYDVRNVDSTIFGGFNEAQKAMLLVEQCPGWTIFVPSGWYHQVENITDCISINHNWCNVTNLSSMYTSMLTAVADVEDALSDVYDLLRTRSGNPEWAREWFAVVQDVLRKDSGWDWTTFWRMVVYNIGQLKDPPLVPSSIWSPPPKTLCVPVEEATAVVKRLLDHFSSARVLEVTNIPGLSGLLDDLHSILSVH